MSQNIMADPDFDPDLIASIYAVVLATNDPAAKVVESLDNRSRYAVWPTARRAQRHGRRERESTQPLLEEPDDHAPPGGSCLQLRFSHPPRTPHGFVFGADAESDIVMLEDADTASSRHFAVTLDSCCRLVVRDLGSLNGTQVTYGDQGRGRRSNFVWIVSGDSNLDNDVEIVISIGSTLAFRLIVPCSLADRSQTYLDNVHHYLARAAAPDPQSLVGHLTLGPSRPRTVRGTGLHTPGTGPIALTKQLGQGAFGVVSRVWDVSTGYVYALKQPSERAIRRKQVDVRRWRTEADILGRIDHDHVVRLLGANFKPAPRLSLEYMPCGSLDDFDELSEDQCRHVLVQCLSALNHIHGLSPPIVHRDLKPENILVHSIDETGLPLVKFGDFGLSRESADPTSICGTRRYLAPEILEEDRRRRHGGHGRRSYTAAVDIWSLGVVVLQLLPFGLPPGRGDERDWCQMIVDKLNEDLEQNWDSLRHFVSEFMALIQPQDRSSAKMCYECAQSTFADGSLAAAPADHYYSGAAAPDLGEFADFADYYGGPEPTGAGPVCPPAVTAASPPPSSGKGKRPKKSSSSSSNRTVRPPKRKSQSSAATAAEPRISEIPDLFDPLHELGGGSSLAALIGESQGGEQLDSLGYSSGQSPTPANADIPVPAYYSVVGGVAPGVGFWPVAPDPGPSDPFFGAPGGGLSSLEQQQWTPPPPAMSPSETRRAPARSGERRRRR